MTASDEGQRRGPSRLWPDADRSNWRRLNEVVREQNEPNAHDRDRAEALDQFRDWLAGRAVRLDPTRGDLGPWDD